jgi:hypothetical protein
MNGENHFWRSLARRQEPILSIIRIRMFKFSIIIAIIAIVTVACYLLRRNFRRMFYVLWTGDENPDFEALEEKWYGKK